MGCGSNWGESTLGAVMGTEYLEAIESTAENFETTSSISALVDSMQEPSRPKTRLFPVLESIIRMELRMECQGQPATGCCL